MVSLPQTLSSNKETKEEECICKVMPKHLWGVPSGWLGDWLRYLWSFEVVDRQIWVMRNQACRSDLILTPGLVKAEHIQVTTDSHLHWTCCSAGHPVPIFSVFPVPLCPNCISRLTAYQGKYI